MGIESSHAVCNSKSPYFREKLQRNIPTLILWNVGIFILYNAIRFDEKKVWTDKSLEGAN